MVARQDSNPGPIHYECTAQPTELQALCLLSQKKKILKILKFFINFLLRGVPNLMNLDFFPITLKTWDAFHLQVLSI